MPNDMKNPRTLVSKCQQCADQHRKCNSLDCIPYKNYPCTERVVGGKWRMGSWVYYLGAGRPWMNGDKINFGDQVQVMGPGEPKTGAKSNEKDRAAPKDDRLGYKGDELVWVEVYVPGNMNLITVKTIGANNPIKSKFIWPIPPRYEGDEGEWVDDPTEPHSDEAKLEKARYMKAMADGQLPIDSSVVGDIPKACDKLGRIKDGGDGTYCDDDSVCVTSVPFDLDKVKGYKLSQPSEKIAGLPWCVPDKLVEDYPGPIEIKCPATGKNVKKPGFVNGCHWHEQVSREDNIRLPGAIIRRYGRSGGWFVGTGSHFTEKQAEKWIMTGKLDLKKPDLQNSEFLAKAPAKA